MRFQAVGWALAWAVASAASAQFPVHVQGQESVSFSNEIRPILSNRCFKCHGPDDAERQGGLRLDRRESATAAADSGQIAVVPGDPQASELLRRVTDPDESMRMPPADSGAKLSDQEVERLRRWIADGAAYERHWSYVPPQRPPLPAVKNSPWPRNEVDRFILHRLEQEGLAPSPEAERTALVRRVALDLTGLPPSESVVEEFLADSLPGAYERLVDRLLEDRAFGEHWARKWLDLARYADSAGYADDPPRTIWAYRDWVIRALNDNLPFDQFTIDQLAGDLLPDPTEDQLIATAFHRNTLTNNEGGTNDEEFRNVAVVDRVNTTMAVWMGTTIHCAQCHNHKYDPISQEEYFQLFDLLNQTADADRRDEGPLLELYTPKQIRQRDELRGEIAQLEAEVARQPRPSPNETENAGEQPEQQPEKPPASEQGAATPQARLDALRKQLEQIKPRTTVPVLRELPADQRRTTNVQLRGNYLDLGQPVSAGLPSAFHAPPADAPLDRLALARWLIAPENPLTARVVVNRLWESIFGTGLVATSEEFGAQGDLPSHPQLLDWLATELVRQGWDTKAVLRLLVTSATYRQESRVTDELLELDPDNRLLARGPRFRLSAEMIRDQALCVSGLLSDTMYGPPVQPPQPQLGLSAAFGGGIDWKTSEGEDRYRRALYTTWRRSNPYPSMTTFDAPNREVCTVRRSRTNTPLQALVTLNDPVFVEAAQALARRMEAHPGDDAARVVYGFQLCLVRPPRDAERDALIELWERARAGFAQQPQQALAMATDPLGSVPEGADVVDLAAWTVVANVLLNLDEMFMKR